MNDQIHKTVADVLPVQDHYYLLHDGEKYARHGTEEANGLLVFPNLERAEQFCMTVGRALPAFQPKRVTAEQFISLAEDLGAFCIADRLGVAVCLISEKQGGKYDEN